MSADLPTHPTLWGWVQRAWRVWRRPALKRVRLYRTPRVGLCPEDYTAFGALLNIRRMHAYEAKRFRSPLDMDLCREQARVKLQRFDSKRQVFRWRDTGKFDDWVKA